MLTLCLLCFHLSLMPPPLCGRNTKSPQTQLVPDPTEAAPHLPSAEPVSASRGTSLSVSLRSKNKIADDDQGSLGTRPLVPASHPIPSRPGILGVLIRRTGQCLEEPWSGSSLATARQSEDMLKSVWGHSTVPFSHI